MDKHHIAIVFTFMMSDEWDWIFFASQFSLKSCGCDIFWDLYQANIFSDTTTMLDYNVVHILPLSKKKKPQHCILLWFEYRSYYDFSYTLIQLCSLSCIGVFLHCGIIIFLSSKRSERFHHQHTREEPDSITAEHISTMDRDKCPDWLHIPSLYIHHHRTVLSEAARFIWPS